MSDLRVCTLHDEEVIDLDDCQIVSQRRTRTTVMKDNRPHILLSKRASQAKIKNLPTQAVIVNPAPPPVTTAPDAEEVPVVESPDNQTEETTTETPSHAAVRGTGGQSLVEQAQEEQGDQPAQSDDWLLQSDTTEDWSPQTDEWYLAKIERTSRRGFAFAVLSNGESVYIFYAVVQPWQGGHTCLEKGDEVEVRIQASNRKYGSPWEAIECVSRNPQVRPDRQAGVVTQWNGYGFVRRSCDCSILALPREEKFFEPGDQVEVWDIRQGNKGYLAREIELVTTVDEEA